MSAQKNYFLNNPVSRFKYMKIPLKWIPQYITNQYSIIYLLDTYGFVYFDICNGMYGLKKAACIDFEHLVQLLKYHGYYTLRSNPRIWYHETLPTKFLCG